MLQLNHKDLIGGVLIALLGGFVGYSAVGLGIGDASRMGPGYMLAIVAAGMIVFGIAMAVGSARYQDPLPRIAWRPLIAVTSGMSAFAALLGHLGLIPAVLLLIGLSALGDRDARPVSTLVLAVSVSVGMWVVFVYGLRIPLPAFALEF